MGQCCSTEYQHQIINSGNVTPLNPNQGDQPDRSMATQIDELPLDQMLNIVKARFQELGYYFKKNGKIHDLVRFNIYKLRNSQTYQGQWKENQKHGYGFLLYRDGSLYEGEFNMGVREGLGRMIYTNGEYYEGEWQKDIIQGQGKYHYIVKNQFMQFIIYRPTENKLKRIRIDGKCYNGEFTNGIKNGQGEISWKDGRSYKGLWKNNQYFGNGVQYKKQKIKWKEGEPMENSQYKSQYSEEEEHHFGLKNHVNKNKKVYAYNNDEEMTQQSVGSMHQSIKQLQQENRIGSNLTISVVDELRDLKDIDMQTLLQYLDLEDYESVVQLGVQMLDKYQKITYTILNDFVFILYVISLAQLNLGNNEKSIKYLQEIDELDLKYPNEIHNDILAATYGMLANVFFQIEIESPNLHKNSTCQTQETQREDIMYQGSLNQAYQYGIKARKILTKKEITFLVRTEVIVNICVAFLINEPKYGYQLVKEELEDIKQRIKERKSDKNQQQKTINQKRLHLLEGYQITGLTNLSLLCVKLKYFQEGFEISNQALNLQRQQVQGDIKQRKQMGIILSNLSYFSLALQDVQNAIKYGEESIQIDKVFYLAYRNLAIAYSKKQVKTNMDKKRFIEIIKFILSHKEQFSDLHRKIEGIINIEKVPNYDSSNNIVKDAAAIANGGGGSGEKEINYNKVFIDQEQTEKLLAYFEKTKVSS